MRVGIIVGHDEKSQGARTYNNITEYTFNYFVAQMMKQLHEFKVLNNYNKIAHIEVIDRNDGWAAVQNIIKKSKCLTTLELHFNSFEIIARGVETLAISGDDPSESFASFISSRIAKEYRSTIRHGNGVYDVSSGERGFHNLNQAKSAGTYISVLVEPGFLNHKSAESKAIVCEPLRYANIIYKALEDWVDTEERLLS